MKELYIIWGIVVSFVMVSANSTGTRLFDIFSDSDSYSSGSGGYGRGWGGGGGYHK